MSTKEEIDTAISTLEQAVQALKDLGFITEEEENE
jgi:predicted transcriptional regulator